MSADSNLRGAIFEELVAHFARQAGYAVCEADVGDEQLYSRGGMPMVHGLGEGHNADVLLVPPMTLPMTPDTRLLVECKGYAGRVGLDVIRGAITIRNDLNAYKRLSPNLLEERRAGRRRLPIEVFPYYHVAVAGLHGFSGPAQTLAATYHVELLDYQRLPILGRLPDLVSGLRFAVGIKSSESENIRDLTPAQGAVLRVRQAMSAALQSEVAGPLSERLRDEPWIDDRLFSDLHEILDIALRVQACYSVTLPDGTSLLMLAQKPIELDPGVTENFEFSISYDRASMSWELHVRAARLQFQLPPELFRAWREGDFTRRAASAIKREHFNQVELFGFIHNVRTRKEELRHVRGYLAQQSLQRTAVDWEEAQKRSKRRSLTDGPKF